jgi:protein TonB
MELPAQLIRDEDNRSTGRLISLGAVVMLHVVLIYALVNGLGKTIVDAIQVPIETRIVPDSGSPPDDVAPPPPPPPLAPPPPPTIALPDIMIEQPPPSPPLPVQQTTTPPVARPHPVAPPHPPHPSVPDSPVSVSAVSRGQPSYPPRMLEQDREGRVDVVCDIDAQGAPRNCNVTNVVGGQDFVASALEWLRTTARYKPQIRNGVPVPTPRHALSVKFRIAQ